MRKKKLIRHLKQQRGMTLLETMIALAVMSFIIAATVPSFRKIRHSMDRMSARQTATALESELRAILSNQNNVIVSAKNSSNATIRSCIVNHTSCTDNATFSMPMYIAGQPTAISGPDISYSREGKRCAGENCGPIKVNTSVRTYCSPAGASGRTCTDFTALAIRFEIIDTEAKSKTPLASDVVEMIPEAQINPNLYLTCRSGRYLRGIGLNGTASCAAIRLNGGGNTDVERKTCFRNEKVTKPKEGGAEGETEEIEVEVKDDSHYIKRIGGNGKITCEPKTW